MLEQLYLPEEPELILQRLDKIAAQLQLWFKNGFGGLEWSKLS